MTPARNAYCRHGVNREQLLNEPAGLNTRQPVVIHEPVSDKVVVIYNTCTYVSSASCTGRDVWYRTYTGVLWSAPVQLAADAADQLEITAATGGGNVYLAWQNKSISLYQVQFHIITPPLA